MTDAKLARVGTGGDKWQATVTVPVVHRTEVHRDGHTYREVSS
jgi:hypothetical protein